MNDPTTLTRTTGASTPPEGSTPPGASTLPEGSPPPGASTPVPSAEAAPTSWRRLLGIGAALVGLLTLMVTAFMWPAVTGRAHDVPLGVVAPPAEAQQVAAALEAAQPGAFAITAYADADAARRAVENREVYGAVVLDAEGGRMLTAPAASPAVAAALGQVADALAAHQAEAMGVAVPDLLPTEPVVGLPAGDARGAGLPAAALPLVLASLAAGVGAGLLVRGLVRRVALVGGVALAGGVAVTLVAGPWLGVLTGDFWAQAGVVALGVGAIGLTAVGAHALLGRGGLALVAGTMVLLGNPLSAAAAAPELLPAGWAELGQGLPPGAVVAALRSVAYFDGAAAGPALGVLVAWLVGGAALLAAAAVVRGRRRRPGHRALVPDAPQEDHPHL